MSLDKHLSYLDASSRYLLWVELDGFYANHYWGVEGALVVERDKVVLDANDFALKKSIRRGMDVKEAKALTERCEVVKWKQDEYANAQRKWLDICCRYTGIIEPIDQHIAALDLSAHPNPFDISEQLIRDLAGISQVRSGAAGTKWIARLVAKLNSSFNPDLESPADFLAPLPIDLLFPIDPANRERLTFLGYHKIGEVAKVPLSTLRNQFGDQGQMIKMAANGGLLETVQALYPPDSLRETFFLESPDDSLPSIENALQLLAERLGQRLVSKSMQGSLVTLQFECESGAYIDLTRRFMKPVHNPKLVMIAFGLMLQDQLKEDKEELNQYKKPRKNRQRLIGQEVVAIRASLFELETIKHSQQSVFGSTQKGREQQLAALKYVRTVFGDDSIKLGGEIEIPRRVKVLKEWQSATGWR